METYCVSYKKNTAKFYSKRYLVMRTTQNKIILLSNYAVCDKKKSRFIKNQELVD